MTKQEARIALSNGEKVIHTSFTDNEFILLNEKQIPYFEDGVQVPYTWWNRSDLEDGWSIKS